jgi:hypothetical protein
LRIVAQHRRNSAVPYLPTAVVALDVSNELGRGVRWAFISGRSGFTCTSLFPQSSGAVKGAWSLVSSPHATRKCRLLPEAQDRGLTFVIRMHRLSHPAPAPAHLHLQDTWRAWVRRDCVASKRRRAASATQSADMVREVGSLRTWTWMLASFASAPLSRYVCNNTAPRGQSRQRHRSLVRTRYSLQQHLYANATRVYAQGTP